MIIKVRVWGRRIRMCVCVCVIDNEYNEVVYLKVTTTKSILT